jgi:hypothetical protein
MDLKNRKKGDLVLVGCDSSMGTSGCGPEEVISTSIKHDTDTGVAYTVLHLSGGRTFDARDGNPIDGPSAYYLT